MVDLALEVTNLPDTVFETASMQLQPFATHIVTTQLGSQTIAGPNFYTRTMNRIFPERKYIRVSKGMPKRWWKQFRLA